MTPLAIIATTALWVALIGGTYVLALLPASVIWSFVDFLVDHGHDLLAAMLLAQLGHHDLAQALIQAHLFTTNGAHRS
jgi:hypothetical protein